MMKINIAPPLALHGIGKRTNNEDNLYPQFRSASTDDKLFLVCDGVGGSEKGEVASEITCRAISGYYLRNRIYVSDDQTVNNAVAFAGAEIERYLANNPGSEGMATTLTFLHLHENGATVAHIGDSRVYHVRHGEILWKTQDHSYVNDLVKAGLITETEALTHPQRNVIMRALHGKDKEVKPDIHAISDLRTGDYFFLCSDGILESVTESQLSETLGMATSDKAKMDFIENRCQETSNDNFTAYLIRILSVENLTVQLLPTEKTKKAETKNIGKTFQRNFLTRNLWWVIVLMLVLTGWYFIDKNPAKSVKVKPKTELTEPKTDSLIPALPESKPAKNLVKNKSKKQKNTW